MRKLLLILLALAAPLAAAHAQRHSGITSPPTAPPPKQAAPPPPEPIVAASTGMGPLQFAQANLVVPEPQVLLRQLQSDDDSIRSAAFSTFGIPAAYLAHGRVAPLPHSVQLEFVPLGDQPELDAILTVELDLHLVSAILVPAEGGWRRIATVTYLAAYANPNTNLGTFVRTMRSIRQPQHYVAIFHGSNTSPNGDITENEAHLRILNGHADITVSFVSYERICEPSRLQAHTPPHECEVTQRWIQADPHEPLGNALMVIATGRVSVREANDPISRGHLFDVARARGYSCQPFLFSDETGHYEPTANPTPCFARPGPPQGQPPVTPLTGPPAQR